MSRGGWSFVASGATAMVSALVMFVASACTGRVAAAVGTVAAGVAGAAAVAMFFAALEPGPLPPRQSHDVRDDEDGEV